MEINQRTKAIIGSAIWVWKSKGAVFCAWAQYSAPLLLRLGGKQIQFHRLL